MKKISTLYKKDPSDLCSVINEINPENEWVLNGEGIPTRKFDGTAVAIINGEFYKRYDVKKGKKVPENAIPCQQPDEITGHWPHWVKCDRNNPADKYHFEGLDNLIEKIDGTNDGTKIETDEEINEVISEYKGQDIDSVKKLEYYEKEEILEEDGWRKIWYDYEYEYSNAFLTEKACKHHIECNAHHYFEGTDYISHAFRNPELETLLKFICQLSGGEIHK